VLLLAGDVIGVLFSGHSALSIILFLSAVALVAVIRLVVGRIGSHYDDSP
jgi:hypothetical protein